MSLDRSAQRARVTMMRFVVVRRDFLLRLVAFAVLAGVVLLVVGCGVDTPQNTFSPEGEVARDQRDLFNLVLWPAVVILVIVEGLLIIALMRFRQRREGEPLPKQVHGNTRLEIAWTIAPAVLLLILAVPTVAAIIDLGREPAKDALQVRVIAQQWSWQFEYPGLEDAEGEPLVTIGELHVPTGREIGVELESRDVVHSFWVPKLAGKTDVFPVLRDRDTGELIAGRVNRFWFNATEPGSFSGQCAEFCGLQHALMRFCVIAHEDFDGWLATARSFSGVPQPESCEDEGALARLGE